MSDGPPTATSGATQSILVRRRRSGNRFPLKIFAFVAAAAVVVAAMGLAGYGLLQRKALRKEMADAVDVNKVEKARELADSFFNLSDVRDRHGRTPLHTAAHCGDRALAEKLIEKGADIQAADEQRLMPLHEAARCREAGGAAVIELLVARGANVDARSNGKLTPLMLAACEGTEGNVRALLAGGTDARARDRSGRTVLHWIRFPLNAKARAEALLAAGADVNAADDDGETPLFCAVKTRDTEYVEFLISKGADINARDMLGASVLGSIKDNDYLREMADFLRKAGAKE